VCGRRSQGPLKFSLQKTFKSVTQQEVQSFDGSKIAAIRPAGLVITVMMMTTRKKTKTKFWIFMIVSLDNGIPFMAALRHTIIRENVEVMKNQ
jgi:hypothetical protein